MFSMRQHSQFALWFRSVGTSFLLVVSFLLPGCSSGTTQTQTTISKTYEPHVTVPEMQLDRRIQPQTYASNRNFRNTNSTFGSRFDFSPDIQGHDVFSGTDGVFHDNSGKYVVGVTSSGTNATDMFHWGDLNTAEGDAYVLNEKWTAGIDTTRWQGDSLHQQALHLTVDIINTFRSTPGCTHITSNSDCLEHVKDATLPVLLIGVTLTNDARVTRTGTFVFGSNRALSLCSSHVSSQGTHVTYVQYRTSSDMKGGSLFMAGLFEPWQCSMSRKEREGLQWSYSILGGQKQTNYLVIGGWNASVDLFHNTRLPVGCQGEPLYYTTEFSSPSAVADFAIDNMMTGDNLLQGVQMMEDASIDNPDLTVAQRWLLGETLRSWEGDTWLVARKSCAGSGYDAAVYEGTYGFLSTLDVMHEYGYFEIARVPWFFRSEMQTLIDNASIDQYGTYFRHDNGSDLDSSGNCLEAGFGTPTITAKVGCVWEPQPGIFGTEENSDAVLLTAYFVSVLGKGSHDFITPSHIATLDAAMQHNVTVGDPATGIAYHGQDTSDTYDDQHDCLHNSPGDSARAGNQYYQGLKEAAAYHAMSYLDGLVSDNNAAKWTAAANRIEYAMIAEYNAHGFIPLGQDNSAFNNCGSRSIVLDDGLFYLALIGHITDINLTLLHDLAQQYPTDLAADTLTSPAMVATESLRNTGGKCPYGSCQRYEWFSKAMLSAIVAGMVFVLYGCHDCFHLDVATRAYQYNWNFGPNFGDGLHDNGIDWIGHSYPRGLIAWAYLDDNYTHPRLDATVENPREG